MKNAKRFTAVLACLLAVALLFTACSGKPKNMEAYLKNGAVAEQLKEQIGNINTDELSAEVSAEGNTLIYTFTYETEGDSSGELFSTMLSGMLKQAMESQSETFESLVDDLQQEVQEENVRLRIVFNTPDGTEIYSGEFE